MGAKDGRRLVRLETWRLTSRDRARLDAAAQVYGGEVKPWVERAGEFELYTESDTLVIAVVPGMALSQSYEYWDQPGGKGAVSCLRRCDGDTEQFSGESCLCVAEDDRICKPTTRLSVLLTDIPGIGCWRLETRGWNAATELAGSAALLERLAQAGAPVPARLRITPRESRRDGQLRKFPVPVIDIDLSANDLLALAAPGARALPALPPGNADPQEDLSPRGHTPLTRPAREGPSVAEGLDAAARAGEEAPSSRVPPVGPTDLESREEQVPVPVEKEEPPAPPPARATPADAKTITDAQRGLLFKAGSEKKMSEDEIKELIHSVGGVESVMDLPRSKVDDVLREISAWPQSDPRPIF